MNEQVARQMLAEIEAIHTDIARIFELMDDIKVEMIAFRELKPVPSPRPCT